MTYEDATILVELLPRSSESELRLDDFLEQMQSIKFAFRETDRFVSGSEPSLYLRIKTMHKNSPMQATLEAVPEVTEAGKDFTPHTAAYASQVVRTMTTNLRVIANRKRLPGRADVTVLDSYRKMVVPVEKYSVDVRIQSRNHSVVINRQFREILDTIVGENEYSYGSVSGVVEGINIHERNRRFWLYPTVGPSRIMGTFRARDRKRFAQAVDQYVTVYGRLSYKSWDKFPHAVLADDLIIHETLQEGLASLKGIAPDATGTLNSREFVDQLRDEW